MNVFQLIAVRILNVCAIAVVFLLSDAKSTTSYANEDQTLTAYMNFLANGDFNNANFYLQNGLIDPATLDTARVFHHVYNQVYVQQREKSLPAVGQLYDYLSSIKPIDLNAPFVCDSTHREASSCTLLNNLAQGMPVAVFRFFAERGLDLNRTHEGFVPATFSIIDQLGTQYYLADINALSASGMVFGDETYDPVVLSNDDPYDRRNLYNRYAGNNGYRSSRALNMPHNYLSIQSFNFMDVLVVALANDLSGSQSRRSTRSEFLCQYIQFAAQSFRPSFDYLRYVLVNRDQFRASQIGNRVRDGRSTADPFPAGCVKLVAGMAQNHGRLNEVVSHFGAQGDVETARWLLTYSTPPAAANSTQPPVAADPNSQSSNGGVAPAVLNPSPTAQ